MSVASKILYPENLTLTNCLYQNYQWCYKWGAENGVLIFGRVDFVSQKFASFYD
jgi:hypothetical protein